MEPVPRPYRHCGDCASETFTLPASRIYGGVPVVARYGRQTLTDVSAHRGIRGSRSRPPRLLGVHPYENCRPQTVERTQQTQPRTLRGEAYENRSVFVRYGRGPAARQTSPCKVLIVWCPYPRRLSKLIERAVSMHVPDKIRFARSEAQFGQLLPIFDPGLPREYGALDSDFPVWSQTKVPADKVPSLEVPSTLHHVERFCAHPCHLTSSLRTPAGTGIGRMRALRRRWDRCNTFR